MKTLFLTLAMVLYLSACQNGSPERSGGVMDQKEMAPAMEEGRDYSDDQSTEVQLTEQKVIRNGVMNIKVDDALKAKTEIDVILSKYKAYIGNEQFNNTDYSANYYIQIRVPAENLDALVGELEGLKGQVTNKSINATDVTEEYIDLETRLKNKRSYLDQYRELLKTARTVEDILKVREQIRILEEEIESVEGRLKYLRNQVSLSTLDLTLTQEKDYVYRPDRKINFFERLKESLSAGWYGFIDFCLRLIGLWPFWLVLIILIWLLRRFKKKKYPPVPPSQPITES